MKLTEEQIKDLESRGIKPGVNLKCAIEYELANGGFFNFGSWDQFECFGGTISSVERIGKVKGHTVLYYVFLKDGDKYATTV